MYSNRDDTTRTGRPPLDPDEDSVRKSVVVTPALLKDIKSRIEMHGGFSGYVRYLIAKDLGKKGTGNG